MSYHEEERTRLRRQSARQAIALAMEGRWKEAIEVNKTLIENFPGDVDAYNRLGRAHMELGEYSLSRAAYQKALDVDPYNIIASKNLSRLANLVDTKVDASDGYDRVELQQFIEEAGKAGVVELRRLGSPDILARAVAGSKVTLNVEGQRLLVVNGKGEYLGQVEPRHAQRLIKLMEGGNRYSALIVSTTETSATVIIREVYQHPSQVGQLSFPSRGPDANRGSVTDRLGDMIIRRQLEFEDALPGESGYAIIDGEEVEYFDGDSDDSDDDIDEDE